ncbi:MAG TPA: DUF892 family protein [Gaiellaceae bacterium]|nr:DUF892 family protein [Gaiellaceae bacterium]
MIATPQELFAHRLRSTLWIEQTLVDEILPTMGGHVHSIDLKYAIEHHTFETQHHVRTLQSVLHRLGESAEAEPSPALLGLRADHDAMMNRIDLSRHDVVDLMHGEMIAATEHHEMAVYESLVATANALGEEEIATMLEEIREQEEHALEVVTRATAKLLAEKVESLRLDA